jgi:hypothetical protein
MFVTHNQYFNTTDEVLDQYNSGAMTQQAMELLLISLWIKRHKKCEDVAKELVVDGTRIHTKGYVPGERI